MVLVIGLWMLLRALAGGSMAVALENVSLRRQLAVLQRSGRRPKLHRWDRAFWVCLSRVWSNWRCSLMIVQSRHGHRVAPPEFSALLALEITTSRRRTP